MPIEFSKELDILVADLTPKLLDTCSQGLRLPETAFLTDVSLTPYLITAALAKITARAGIDGLNPLDILNTTLREKTAIPPDQRHLLINFNPKVIHSGLANITYLNPIFAETPLPAGIQSPFITVTHSFYSNCHTTTLITPHPQDEHHTYSIETGANTITELFQQALTLILTKDSIPSPISAHQGIISNAIKVVSEAIHQTA